MNQAIKQLVKLPEHGPTMALVKRTPGKENIWGTFVAWTLGRSEATVIHAVEAWLPARGCIARVNSFDGLMIDGAEGLDAKGMSALLTDASAEVKAKTGFDVKFAEKPLEPKYLLPVGDEYDTVLPAMHAEAKVTYLTAQSR